VYSGKIPPEKYRDKIVLIGSTASGVGSVFATPVSTADAPTMAAVLMTAHAVSSILQEHFFVTPVWGAWVSLACAGTGRGLLDRCTASAEGRHGRCRYRSLCS
jgi:serine/threonine-protein kinase